MKTKYYSCTDKQELVDAFISVCDLTDKSGYNDWDISIDIIGNIDTTPSIYDNEGNMVEEIEPTYTDFLFNVIFVTNKYKKLFKNVKEEKPKTPFREFA